MVDKVIPNGLNYADLKPQSIENEIKLIRFTPTSTVNGAQGNDVVKFMMQGNGFFDPYSAYIKITVKCAPTSAGEIRFLDRSAHSFINRLVIRSQGQELERIEQYDVIAAMINDVLYSQEQNILHSYEGFPSQEVPFISTRPLVTADQSTGGRREYNDNEVRNQVIQVLGNGASPIQPRMIGEPAFFSDLTRIEASVIDSAILNYPINNDAAKVTEYNPVVPTAATHYNSSLVLGTLGQFTHHVNGQRQSLLTFTKEAANTLSKLNVAAQTTMTFCIPIYSGVMGVLMPDKKLLPLSLMPLDVEFTLNPHALYSNYRRDHVSNDDELGVARPGSRDYVVTNFEIFAHMLFFEQEVHRSLEAVVAENGIFIHFNSFYLAPITAMQGMPGYAQINVHFKSINSVHFVFLYNQYESEPACRKLDFKSHNLTKLQIRNGTYLIPSEPIEGTAGSSQNGGHIQFMLEMYKAWNKLHDPATDGAISAYNFCDDEHDYNEYGMLPLNLGMTLDTNPGVVSPHQQFLQQLIAKQSLVGRCQYAISLVGEELGSESSIITGKKAELPFDINLTGSKAVSRVYTSSTDLVSTVTSSVVRNSYMMTYVRADFVIYVRPDLVVTVIGR